MGFPTGKSLASHIGETESPYQIAKNIKHHMERLTAMDPTHIRRKKDYGRFNYHRLLKSVGLSHEARPYKSESDSFTTGLSELQSNATLPPTPLHHRFPFPHTLHYKAHWGPPTVETEPNRYEGSMVGVSVSFRVQDLLLASPERQRLIDIVGPDRYDVATDVVTVDADIFPDRNHNAAYLGDVLQQLIRLSLDEQLD